MKLCKGKILVNVEIKDETIGSEVCKFLDSLSINDDDYFISSFHEKVLKDVATTHPNVKLGYLFYKNFFSSKPVDIAMKYKCDAIHPWYRILSTKLIKKALENNLEINIWTVNGENSLKKFMGDPRIASLITNDVGLALKLKNI
jgi:glycerophosphoryl diester phosphodiesterase